MTSDIWNISNMNEICEIRVTSPYISLFEPFESNRPFICDQHQTIKQ